MKRETWYLMPRDPLAIGDGRGPVPFVTRKTQPMPLPGTVAGMVRASFLQDRGQVSDEDARQVLKIRVGAPWLVQLADPAEGAAGDVVDHLLLAPADAREAAGTSGAAVLYRGAVHRLGADEGVLWPPSLPALDHLVRLPERTRSGAKLDPPRQRFWPLDALVRWSLGEDPSTDDFRAALAGTRLPDGPEVPGDDDPDQASREEQRIHVGIDDETQTAEPAILFSSTGRRMGSAYAIAAEVDLPPDTEGGPGARDLVVLGGESRLSFLARRSGSGFPGFERFRDHYLQALERQMGVAKDHPVGIRLQLLSHAYLPPPNGGPACLPSWHVTGAHPDLPPGLRLRLAALCIPTGPVAISGWNLRARGDGADSGGEAPSHSGGGPREIRRLVPAGSAYYFLLEDEDGAPVGGDRLVDACEALWWTLIDPRGPGEDPEPSQFRTSAGDDGYGRILPGYWCGDCESWSQEESP